ncbi:hypothetical protein [Streptomyces rapamycinicus]|uniref:hypothetical protein n=1 Tax=Streptomyces rapamycinicus TaxID=1226757 RepID=UPI0032D918FF
MSDRGAGVGAPLHLSQPDADRGPLPAVPGTAQRLLQAVHGHREPLLQQMALGRVQQYPGGRDPIGALARDDVRGDRGGRLAPFL